MEMSAPLFYFLSTMVVGFAACVLLAANPIYSAIFLALTMVSLSFVYFLLQAYFIAGVQLAVYAGAVMVLFVMVLMLFDLKQEHRAYTKGVLSALLKIGSAAFLCGMLVRAFEASTGLIEKKAQLLLTSEAQMNTTKELAILLFSKYLFAFEALGLLLLLIAVGVVAVSKVKGGTHAKH